MVVRFVKFSNILKREDVLLQSRWLTTLPKQILFYSYDDFKQILSLPSLSKVFFFFCRSINLVLPLHPQTTHTCTTTLFTTFTCVHYIFRQKSFNFGNDLVNITSTMLSRTIWLVGFLYFVISLQYSNVQYLMFL